MRTKRPPGHIGHGLMISVAIDLGAAGHVGRANTSI
jgi:hypothetical protein